MTGDPRVSSQDAVAAQDAPVSSQDAVAPRPHPVALRMQILTTEHWSLLSSRGLAWTEAFARVGMYLTSLSGAMVALGLVGGLDRSGETFRLAALAILPVLLFVGVTTVARLAATNYHDAMAVVGMNRIRAAYLEVAPELGALFVMGVHDDAAGVARTMAVPPGVPPLVHMLSAAPFLVNVLNGVVAGAIVALLILESGGTVAASLGVGAAAAGIAVAVQLRLVGAGMRRGRAGVVPLYPSTEPDAAPRNPRS